MQPIWICICSEKQFEGTSENSLWRKIAQMQTLPLIWIFHWRDIWELTLALHHTYYHTISNHGALHLFKEAKTLKNWFWRKIVQMQPSNASRINFVRYEFRKETEIGLTNASMHLFNWVIWGHTWKLIPEKNISNGIDISVQAG